MITPFTSPELAPKRPEIKGSAAVEAIQRVETIRLAVQFVLDATEGVVLPPETIEQTPADEIDLDPALDPRMDAALAAVEAAHANPEIGFSQVGA